MNVKLLNPKWVLLVLIVGVACVAPVFAKAPGVYDRSKPGDGQSIFWANPNFNPDGTVKIDRAPASTSWDARVDGKKWGLGKNKGLYRLKDGNVLCYLASNGDGNMALSCFKE